MAILPYANQQEIPDLRFLATWNFWFSRFRPELDPLTDAMPRRAVFSNLASRLEAGHHFSLDVMCRILANPSYRNRAQAVPEMVDANLHLLAPVESVVDLPGAPAVRGVRLSDHGRALLKEMLVDPSLEAFADGLEEGDPVEGEAEAGDIQVTVKEVKAAPVSRTHAFSSDIIRQLVSDIEQEPFQPSYRRVSFGAPVKGWRQRLDAYFWPRPAVGYRQTCDALAPLLVTARQLADSIEKWTPELQAQAVEFADQVFAWGGVVQRTAYDWRDVHAVFASAIRGKRQDDARMNSGWTKVAAFASSHLEPEHNLVIWDSRVAHSLTQRLDAILHDRDCREVPVELRDIGWVPGRGGKRLKVMYRLQGWRNGYGCWKAVYAGSALVRAIRDELNAREVLSYADIAQRKHWTLRDVEMVLFMDGY